MKNEVFEIRDYLVENNYPKGFIYMLDDYFTNKAISKEEYQHFINNYQLRGTNNA